MADLTQTHDYIETSSPEIQGDMRTRQIRTHRTNKLVKLQLVEIQTRWTMNSLYAPRLVPQG